jgi:hypothetical protein
MFAGPLFIRVMTNEVKMQSRCEAEPIIVLNSFENTNKLIILIF